MTIDETPTPTSEQPEELKAVAVEQAPDLATENTVLDVTPADAPQPLDAEAPAAETAEVPAIEEPVVQPESAPAETTPADLVPEEAPTAEHAPEEVAPEMTPPVEAVPAEAAKPVEAVKPVEQTVATRSEEAVASDADLFESYMNAFDAGAETEDRDLGYKRLAKGERIEATIIQVDKDKVFVDLGTKAEGIVPLGELSEQALESAKDHFNVGDKINVVVIRPEGAEGNPIVSKKRADFEEIWDRVEDAFRSGEMITAQVVDRVKGGLVVDVGVRGFVPATHVGSGKLRNIEKFLGQALQLKVIEIDRERKKVVLSNREAEEIRRQSAKEQIFLNVKPGDALEGTIRRLTDYGAFVDLGGVDGLLHISEMSWARISHPKEMFKEGQKIKVMVLRLDPAVGKISLGHRQVLPDPWNLIRDNYKVGQTLKIVIGRLVQSGAFIKLPEGAEAFLPVSEMSNRRIKRPQDVVEENQEVEVQVIDLRPEERRMVLSMRGGSGAEMRPISRDGGMGDDRDRNGKKRKKGRGRDEHDDFEESLSRRTFGATSGATIGERLGMLKGFLNRDEEEETPAAETPAEEAKPEE
jgi:4-hydroxy-3-methylbut-2-enyl diphosphate reductase